VNARDAEALLRSVGQTDDLTIDIAPAALAFATLARPEAGEARYEQHLKTLADDLGAAIKGRSESLDARVHALRSVLIEQHGYRGDRESYDDLRNADLAHVIDRRRGLPVALAILWIHAGRAQGWTMTGLNFPAHFLIRLDGGTLGSAIVDPFNDGRTLDPQELRALLKTIAGPRAELATEHHASVADRAVLIRLQNNIKLRLLKREETAEALQVLERMLLIAPREMPLWHEAGTLHAELENLRAALKCLETAASLAETAPTRQRIVSEIAALRTRLN
jgi:regulator of sirC expression with transglutaminase-like and TPR domain